MEWLFPLYLGVCVTSTFMTFLHCQRILFQFCREFADLNSVPGSG